MHACPGVLSEQDDLVFCGQLNGIGGLRVSMSDIT